MVSNKALSITEAAKAMGMTRQGVYIALKKSSLKASKQKRRWEILPADIKEYQNNRYSRSKSKMNGELIFDNEKGFFSAHQLSIKYCVPVQKIYYALRSGKIKSHRARKAWVIHILPFQDYLQMLPDFQHADPERQHTANVAEAVARAQEMPYSTWKGINTTIES